MALAIAEDIMDEMQEDRVKYKKIQREINAEVGPSR
jgi:hypothetical protein